MYFKIEGKLVQQIDERVTRQVNLNDWLAAIAAQQPFMTPILPVGCRMYVKRATEAVYVVEQRPMRRLLTWQSVQPWGDASRADHKWYLAFPYVVFVARIYSGVRALYVYYRKAPLAESDRALFRCNLSNIYRHDHRICVATSDDLTPLTVDAMIARFWSSEFNGDLLDNFLHAGRIDKRVATLAAWEEASRADPLFPLAVEWEAAVTLSDVIGAESTR